MDDTALRRKLLYEIDGCGVALRCVGIAYATACVSWAAALRLAGKTR